MFYGNRKASLLLFSSIALIFSTLVFLVCVIIYDLNGLLPLITSMILSAATFFCIFLSIWYSHSLARIKFPKYSRFITTKKINFNYDYDFIFAYRCDKILFLLKNPTFKHIDIEDLISYFTNKSGNIKLKRWGPVTLIGLVMFPLWSEFVGVNMGPGWDLLILIVMSVFISLLIIIIHSLLRETLLSKANKYDELVNILIMVKSLKK